jgi:hypothetical protein
MKAYPFIQKHPTSGQTSISEGMDLRDFFAVHALKFLLDQKFDYEEAPKRAYKIADFMLKSREAKSE